MKKLLPAILFLFLLAVMPALGSAEQNSYCDPFPSSLRAVTGDEIPQDCIVLNAPDGTTHVVLIVETGSWLECYRLAGGEWEQVFGGNDAANGSAESRFVRHRADQLRPDGTPYGDDQGFDVVSTNGIYDSYHWNGEYYSLCGWCDPERYSGKVMIQGTVLKYYPEGSTVPECEMDAGDDLTLFGWTVNYDARPAAPQEGAKKAAILADSIRDDFPGRELVEYNSYSSRIEEVDAIFAAVIDDGAAGGLVLRAVRAHYDSEHKGPVTATDLIDVPLSDTLKDVPVKTLWQDAHELLTRPGALDSKRLPAQGKIIDFDLQHNQMVLLTEDSLGARRVVIAVQESADAYSLQESKILPADSWLDTFHTGEDEIQIEFDNQKWGAGYRRASSGWQLDWIMGEGADHMNCTVLQWGVIYTCTPATEDAPWEGQLIGTLRDMDLLTTDFVTIPRTVDALKQSLVQDGWAVVCNPDPEDRLHLRPEAGNREVSLGKYYNGTPVRVLETKGDWCRVKICTDGPEGWMMKSFLAFGERMNSVEPAYPTLSPKEEYEDQPPWADLKMTARDGRSIFLNDVRWHIIGIIEDKYILLNNDGTVAYAPMDWFWAGNG